MLDWDTFYFEYWVDEHETAHQPTDEDYRDWLFYKADLALGEE